MMKVGGKYIASQRGAFKRNTKVPMPNKGKLSPATAAKIRMKANSMLKAGI